MNLKTRCRWLAVMLANVLTTGSRLMAADYPAPIEEDGVLQRFRFASGEELPELHIHYRILGKPVSDSTGRVTNAVLILHGTTGSGKQFIRPEFAGELF